MKWHIHFWKEPLDKGICIFSSAVAHRYRRRAKQKEDERKDNQRQQLIERTAGRTWVMGVVGWDPGCPGAELYRRLFQIMCSFKVPQNINYKGVLSRAQISARCVCNIVLRHVTEWMQPTKGAVKHTSSKAVMCKCSWIGFVEQSLHIISTKSSTAEHMAVACVGLRVTPSVVSQTQKDKWLSVWECRVFV